jgi:hypothetical protein
LVAEEINGRDKVIEELMGDKAVGEMGFARENLGKKEEEERPKEGVLVNSLTGGLSQGHSCCWRTLIEAHL